MTADSEEGTGEDAVAELRAVILDVLPRGRSDDDRPRYRRSPVALGITVDDFQLVELRLEEDSGISIGDRVVLEGPATSEAIEEFGDIDTDDLTGAASSELDYVIEEIVEADESRFVEFFNDAQPVTTRLHSLDLLPGIGETLRNNIIDARRRSPFESFEDLTDRVSGLHDPMEVLVERILQELREDDLKYRLFVRRE